MRPTLRETELKNAELIQRCATILRLTLGNADVKLETIGRRQRNDGEITLRGPWGTMTFTVESKGRVTAETIRPLIAQLKRQNHTAKPLLISAFINPATAAILREEHINFADGYFDLAHANRNAAAGVEQQNLPADLDEGAGAKSVGACLGRGGAEQGDLKVALRKGGGLR